MAYVQTGDRIRLSVTERTLSLLVSDQELAQRAKDMPVRDPLSEPTAKRGYRQLFLQQVLQADEGADFAFLKAVESTGKVPRS